MKILQAVLISMLGVSLTACAQARQGASSATPKAGSDQEAKTKLEAFPSKTGVVVIRGFSTMGSVRGNYGSSIAVETREFTNAADGTKQYGIAIEVSKGGELAEKRTSYVDYDEIDSLLQGIDYISKVDSSATKLDDFQADYRTKGDLEVTTFSAGKGKIMAAVSSGVIGGTDAILPLPGLGQFKDLIVQAKRKLDSIK